MADIEHSEIGPGEVHAPHNWRVANAAARLALSVSADDVGKYVWQLDDGSQWMLRSTGPTVWHDVSGGGAGGVVDSVFGEGAVVVDSTDPANPVVSVNEVDASEAGLMSAADKVKLDGVAAGANNYALPTASGSTLGGVKVGTGLSIDGSGVLSATGGGGGTVDSVVGGTSVSVDSTDPANPVVSVTAATTGAPGSMSAADKAKLDGIAPGATANVGTVTNVTGSGAISVTNGTTTPAISIAAATGSVPGTMSASDKTKLDGMTPGTNLATLVGGLVPSAQLPAYVDDVLEFANLAAFPVTGATGVIYIALDTNKQYRWSGSVYIELVSSPGTTDNVPEGTTNLYFTAARVLAVLLTGFSVATGGAVVATDSILVAAGKLQRQINDIRGVMTTAGDILIGGASGVLTRLGIGSTGQVLTVVAGAPAWTVPVGSIRGEARGLKIDWASATTMTLLATSIIVENSSGVQLRLASVSRTLNVTTVGANGLDAGTIASSTFYYVYAIKDPAGNDAVLASLSATAPTLPSGYTYSSGLIGAFQTDGSGNIIETYQRGNRVSFANYVAVVNGNVINTSPYSNSGVTTGCVPAVAQEVSCNVTTGVSNGVGSNWQLWAGFAGVAKFSKFWQSQVGTASNSFAGGAMECPNTGAIYYKVSVDSGSGTVWYLFVTVDGYTLPVLAS